MTDQEFRTLNAELGFPPEAADRLLHDRRADERRSSARPMTLSERQMMERRTRELDAEIDIVLRNWNFADEGIEI